VPTQITREFNEPFYGGEPGSVSNSVDNIGGSLVAINGRAYPIDTGSNRYTQRSLDVLQQRNTTDNRDLLLLPQNVWRQQVSSWNYGAGQSNLDRDDAIQGRYQNSFGVDPWTSWQISLLPETQLMQATSGQTWLTLQQGYLVVVNDDMTYWWSDYGTMSASVSIGSSTVIDIAERAPTVLTLNNDGYIYQLTSSAGPATTYNPNAFSGANFIAWEKDYLLCGDENILKSVTTTIATTIYTHPESTFRWESACSGPQCIYVLGGVGDQYVVHKVTIKEDGTGLNPAIVAAQLPDGEIGYSISEYLGFIFIGTNKGVRMAQPDANGDLLLGAIIPTDEPVRCFEGQDRFIWYGNSSIPAQYSEISNDPANVFPSAPVPGLGRLDLSTFTTTSLTPAYANDIAVWDEAAANVTSCVTWLGKRVFTVEGSGVYFEGDDRVLGGWLTQGIMSFSVEDLKAALYMQAKWNPDCAGKLYIDLAYDSSGFARYADLVVSNANIRSDNINLHGTKFSRVNMRMVMTRCSINNAKGPIPTRWEIRSFPVKGKASRWDVPVIIADDVDLNGIVEARNPLEDKNVLLSLVENGSVFTYQESGQAYQVLAREFLWQPERLSTTGNGWQGTLLMVLEEVM
jgi:hypothetical protein